MREERSRWAGGAGARRAPNTASDKDGAVRAGAVPLGSARDNANIRFYRSFDLAEEIEPEDEEEEEEDEDDEGDDEDTFDIDDLQGAGMAEDEL